MKAGDPIIFDVALADATGAGLSYADYTAFTTAGWSLTFIDPSTGSALGSPPSATLAPVSGINGRHRVMTTATSSAYMVRITPPNTNFSYTVLPTVFWDGTDQDTDAVYNRLTSVYTFATGTSVQSGTLPSAVEGDSYSATLTTSAAYLARMGWSDLTGATLTGTIRRPGDTTIGTPACTLNGTGTPPDGLVAINGSNPTSVDISWTTYPTGMVLATDERTAGAVDFRVEIQAVKAGKKLTVAYNVKLTVYRQDNAA